MGRHTIGGNDVRFDRDHECAQPGGRPTAMAAANRAEPTSTTRCPNRLDQVDDADEGALGLGHRDRACPTRGSSTARMATARTFVSPAEEHGERRPRTCCATSCATWPPAPAAGSSSRTRSRRPSATPCCDSPEWLNGLSNPTSESYQPNRTGHSSGYLPLRPLRARSGPVRARRTPTCPRGRRTGPRRRARGRRRTP